MDSRSISGFAFVRLCQVRGAGRVDDVFAMLGIEVGSLELPF
jgi:hypothetical protein